MNDELRSKDSMSFPQHKDLLDAGYAPGTYMFKCMDCGCEAIGDKRARRCRPCAEKRVMPDKCDIPSNQRVIDHLDEVVDSLRYRPVATTAMQMRQAADEIQRFWREHDEDIERMEGAADKIERLTRELTDARRTAEHWKAEHLAGNAEIERLQADNLAVARLILANDRAGAVKWATGLVKLFGVEHGRVTVETAALLPGEDIAEALERRGDPLSLRAARYIRIKWNTEEGMRDQLRHANDRLNARETAADLPDFAAREDARLYGSGFVMYTRAGEKHYIPAEAVSLDLAKMKASETGAG